MPPLAMATIRAPPEWQGACSSHHERGDRTEDRIDALSVFDGHGGMSAAFGAEAFRVASFEIERDASQNVLSMTGIETFLNVVSRMPHDSIAWLAPPCGSWVFLTRSKSKRTAQNLAGAINDSWVRLHNDIADWVARALLFLTSRGIFVVVEQPTDSCLYKYPPVQDALTQIGARPARIQLCNWGQDTLKPLTLWGTAPWLEVLVERNAELAEAIGGRVRKRQRLVTVDDNGKVTGKRGALSESAAYPTALCEFVARCHRDWLASLRTVS